MFFSVEQLIKRDGRFALVWKVATKRAGKKGFDRGTMLSVEIPELCNAIMKRIPMGGTTHDEPRTKFSLYLLGQLVYGVAVILERQVAYLKVDAKTAVDSCNRLYFAVESPIVMETSTDQRNPKKRQKAKKIDGPVTNFGSLRFDMDDLTKNLNIDSFGDFDGVGMAMRNQITLADPVPDWRPPTMFQEDDLLPPTEFERMDMLDFANTTTSDRAGSGGRRPNGISDFLSVSQLKENKKTDTSASIMDVRPPGAEFEELNRPPLDLFDLPPPGPLDQFHDASLQPQMNDTPMEQMRTPLRPKDENRDSQERKRTAADMVQLDPAAAAPVGETPKKKRRQAMCIMDENDTMIPFTTMKEQVMDFSSVLRSIGEIPRYGEKSQEKKLMPLVTPMTYKIPPELKYLYKVSGDYSKMTLADAAEFDLLRPASRGPTNRLWHYESSTNDSKEKSSERSLLDLPPLDEELNMRGIAFLDKTPEKFKQKIDDGVGMLFDLQQQPLNFDMTDPLVNTFPPPPTPDAIDNNIELGRRSQVSGLEDARRSNTFGPQHSRLDNRTGSVLLDNEREFGFSGFKEFSRVNDTSAMSGINNAAAAHIRDAVNIAAGEAISFAELFPPSSVSRKAAARAFSGLLGMIKRLEVSVTQGAPYEDIFISSHAANGDSDFESTLSVEN